MDAYELKIQSFMFLKQFENALESAKVVLAKGKNGRELL